LDEGERSGRYLNSNAHWGELDMLLSARRGWVEARIKQEEEEVNEDEKRAVDAALGVLRMLSEQASEGLQSSSLADDLRQDSDEGGRWVDGYNWSSAAEREAASGPCKGCEFCNPGDDHECPTNECMDGVRCAGCQEKARPGASAFFDRENEFDETVGLIEDSGLNLLADDIHRIARGKGWWEEATLGEDDPFVIDEDLLALNRSLIAEKLLMIHSEISEATEDLRIAKTMSDLSSVDFMDPSNDKKPTGFAIELADTIIRILDLAAFIEIDIEGALAEKFIFNKSRTYRHGNKNL